MPITLLVELGLGDHRVGEDLRVLRRRDRRGRGVLGLLRRLLAVLHRGAAERRALLLLRRGLAVDDRARLRGVPLLHTLEPALLGGREALALDGLDVDDDGPLGLERLAQRTAERRHVVAVDNTDVREVELLEEKARGPVGL